ncbi:hypothetical protein [Longimicrobium terrae]|uniref:Uncharacterized protein n=1 Tax=Longimicrobium terrae TaxID=1639882 RepID=A0A841GJP4_9BACT|nr:hypothetical protein [Longimicrobium terrae]MBB4634323.1 hypothetical protein [Longimicrobium terrae]MBB6068787.1 hypothetical protein [Longimicrobium terrae]NNC27971.1 hypothetical protein [Longimicrobium terrae]
MEKLRLDADLLSVQSFPTAAALAAHRAAAPAREAAPRRKPAHAAEAACTCWPCTGAA